MILLDLLNRGIFLEHQVVIPHCSDAVPAFSVLDIDVWSLGSTALHLSLHDKIDL